MVQPVALKEWAVAVRALERGDQAIVLRKGGIAEETKEFRLESPRFYLFPTFEHQRPELVKPQAREEVARTRAEAAAEPGVVRITAYAEAAEDLELTDEAALERLDAFHLWTKDYAAERLRWKKTKPLHVLLLRVYRLNAPWTLPVRAEYGGCKSWLALQGEPPAAGMTAALDDRAFAEQAERIRRAVASPG
jgi:hypothetical protein